MLPSAYNFSGDPTCAKCTESDDRIARYKRLAMYITDQFSLDGIAGFVMQMMAEKPALNPKDLKK